jgi:hypothetical protein
VTQIKKRSAAWEGGAARGEETMRTITLAALGVVGTALLFGCTGATKKGLSVSASTRGATTTGAATTASLDAGNGLTIDRVRLVVRKVEVEGTPACPAPTTGTPGMSATSGTASGEDHGSGDGSGDSGDSGDGDPCSVSGGPFLLDLSGDALTGGVHWVAGLTLPPGTYHEVVFRIGPVTTAEAGTDAGLLAMATAGTSVAVDGLLSGAAFSFTTDLRATQKREGAIVVDPTTGANVTLDVDPTGWFKAADGTLLDQTKPADLAAILENIRASIRILHDDDQDGVDDDGEHHG